MRMISICLTLSAAALLGGCNDKPTMFKNPDPALRRTRTEFRADAARRAYPVDAPKKFEPKARAQVGYSLNRIEVVNFTGQDWDDVEVWVNGEYVCYVPKMQDRKLKEVHFPMLYNAQGQRFPMDNRKIIVKKVELFHAGTMYSVVCHNADY